MWLIGKPAVMAKKAIETRKKQLGCQGISVPEIIIMASIVSICAVVFIPKYTKSQAESKQKLCQINLRSIDQAVQQWAIENKVNSKSTYNVNTNKILAYLKDGRLPICPTGGTYLSGTNVSKPPMCSHSAEGHTL
jgi:competence protein ComGC